jgi:hypothetical protein
MLRCRLRRIAMGCRCLRLAGAATISQHRPFTKQARILTRCAVSVQSPKKTGYKRTYKLIAVTERVDRTNVAKSTAFVLPTTSS